VSLSVAAVEQSRPPLARRARGFVALTKPRIVELLLVTTVPTMVVARGGIPSGWLILATIAGGALAAGGANAINMFIDRDIDAVMHRTRQRPLVTGVVTPAQALVFAIVLEVAAFAVLWRWVNLLSASLAIAATVFYVFVYTLWLKRTSRQNIVIGGAAGAVPVLVGWSAVTGHVAWAPLVLFGMIFVWTPSHFWALAIRYRDDYGAAGVPMLPAVAPMSAVAKQILAYSALLVVLSFVFGAIAGMGAVYLAAAAVAGAAYLWLAVSLYREPSAALAMKLFHFSITYVTVVFAAMALDVIVRHP
jgi:protoheme IX farnesyltransferase